MTMRVKWDRKGTEEKMRVRARRDFSTTSGINISPFVVLLEQLRNNLLLDLTQAGIKSFCSLLLRFWSDSPSEVAGVKLLKAV